MGSSVCCCWDCPSCSTQWCCCHNSPCKGFSFDLDFGLLPKAFFLTQDRCFVASSKDKNLPNPENMERLKTSFTHCDQKILVFCCFFLLLLFFFTWNDVGNLHGDSFLDACAVSTWGWAGRMCDAGGRGGVSCAVSLLGDVWFYNLCTDENGQCPSNWKIRKIGCFWSKTTCFYICVVICGPFSWSRFVPQSVIGWRPK